VLAVVTAPLKVAPHMRMRSLLWTLPLMVSLAANWMSAQLGEFHPYPSTPLVFCGGRFHQ
jgi:hypothetical protein